MSHFDDAVAEMRKLRPAYLDKRIKITGFLSPDGSVSVDPTTGAQPGYLWVRGYPRGANVQVLAGTDINPHIPNVRVWVGENEAKQAVAYALVIDKSAVDQFGAALGSVATNPVPVAQAIQPVPSSLVSGGRVLLLNSPAPGQKVWVEGYLPALWTDASVAIDPADYPTNPNELRWAVFYFPQILPGQTSTPVYALTPPEVWANLDSLPVSEATALLLPNDALRLGAVSLAYGQTDMLPSNTRTIDPRDWLTPRSPLINYDGSGAPTVNDDETEGYSIGSVWYNGADIYDCTDASVGAAVWSLRNTSSGISQAYAGYNTVGGSTEVMTAGKMYMKKITLASDGLLTDIEAYIDHSAVSEVQGFSAFLMSDNAGAPNSLIQVGGLVANQGIFLNTNARWFGFPIGKWLIAGDYWICVMRPFDPGSDIRIYYDGSGSDQVVVTGSVSFAGFSNYWMADASLYSPSNSGNQYSIRANILS